MTFAEPELKYLKLLLAVEKKYITDLRYQIALRYLSDLQTADDKTRARQEFEEFSRGNLNDGKHT